MQNVQNMQRYATNAKYAKYFKYIQNMQSMQNILSTAIIPSRTRSACAFSIQKVFISKKLSISEVSKRT